MAPEVIANFIAAGPGLMGTRVIEDGPARQSRTQTLRVNRRMLLAITYTCRAGLSPGEG